MTGPERARRKFSSSFRGDCRYVGRSQPTLHVFQNYRNMHIRWLSLLLQPLKRHSQFLDGHLRVAPGLLQAALQLTGLRPLGRKGFHRSRKLLPERVALRRQLAVLGLKVGDGCLQLLDRTMKLLIGGAEIPKLGVLPLDRLLVLGGVPDRMIADEKFTHRASPRSSDLLATIRWSASGPARVGEDIKLIASCSSHGYWGRTDAPDFRENEDGVLVIEKATGGSDLVTRQKLDGFRERGVFIVIDGACLSACTMLLYPEYDNVCWTDEAEFVFHGASLMPTRDRPERQDFPVATKRMWQRYPEYIKRALPDPSEWRHDRYYRMKVADWTVLQIDRHCRHDARYDRTLQ